MPTRMAGLWGQKLTLAIAIATSAKDSGCRTAASGGSSALQDEPGRPVARDFAAVLSWITD